VSRLEKEDSNGNPSKKGNSMEDNSTLEILKQAILLEKRGMAFYQNVAEKTKNRAARDVFEMMAAEEQKHINMLSEQFKAYLKNKKFIPGSHDSENSSVASKVLTKEIKEKISAAGFEAAAISAAILMEEQAVNLYSESMENTSDPEAKALFEWLTRWEREHLSLLLDIDKTLKEKIWFDNKFWPF
jgi:rubrerythrin